MSFLDETAPIPRRTMSLFFIADVSWSMGGSKIGALNQSVKEVLPIIDDISSNNADAEIKVACLEFSSGCKWTFGEPKPASDFIWQDLKTNGTTDMGAACIELSNKLSRKGDGYMQETAGCFAPVLILLSDGVPTDDFPNGLAKLKANRWYQSAIKIAIAIGSDADKEALGEFTGNMEAVITVHNVDALKTIIRTVSVTASQIGSQSSTAGNQSKQEQVNDQVKKKVEDTGGANLGNASDIDDDDWD